MSLRSKLIGTWECLYLKATNVNDPADVIHPYSENLKGNLVYSSDGYVAALIQKPDISKFTPGPLVGTKEQYIEAAAGTQSYQGPFYVDEQEGKSPKLYHEMWCSLPANWIGDTQVRLCEMWEEHGRLFMKLAPEFNMEWDGIERKVEVGWRKREPNTRTTPPSL